MSDEIARAARPWIRRGAAGLALLLAAAIARADSDALTEDELQRLHAELAPREAGWKKLPWEASILAARERARREAKPIYLLVRSGHPLGCV